MREGLRHVLRPDPALVRAAIARAERPLGAQHDPVVRVPLLEAGLKPPLREEDTLARDLGRDEKGLEVFQPRDVAAELRGRRVEVLCEVASGHLAHEALVVRLDLKAVVHARVLVLLHHPLLAGLGLELHLALLASTRVGCDLGERRSRHEAHRKNISLATVAKGAVRNLDVRLAQELVRRPKLARWRRLVDLSARVSREAALELVQKDGAQRAAVLGSRGG
mmetsp:Transcript_29936/g.96249  ORF Transcript_29936/g.96249 Transcript_29936/m.96249 type:complete len:222 (-) Transcript_29936:573-1238(-)